MFLNKTLLKKFIKSSFKWEGLTVGRVYGGLVVAGGTWISWTQEGYIPNWLKAAVMEYTGELPREGCMFKARKDEPIQYEIAENELYDLPGMRSRCGYAYTVTPVVISNGYGTDVRILQQNRTMQMLAASEDSCRLIDLSELGEENAPAGPASVTADGRLLLYKNEHSAYAFTALDGTRDITREIMEGIGHIDFGKEK